MTDDAGTTKNESKTSNDTYNMPVERGDNLHFIIDGLGGVVQIGKCCILLRITFDDTIAKKLLRNGEMACKFK